MHMKDRKYELIKLNKVVEADGSLLVTEVGNRVPFEIKRIFCVKEVKEGCSRGNHATKKTKLILVPVSGSCKVLVDDGVNKEVFEMNDDRVGLYIDEMIWRSMYDFTPDCVMMAICDRVFEPGNETYDNYEEFLQAIKDEEDDK